MTSLEQTLANVLASIERERGGGNPHAILALLERKHAICQALAAPEQAWLAPATEVSGHSTVQRPTSETALAAA
jgi:hypothetical protein